MENFEIANLRVDHAPDELEITELQNNVDKIEMQLRRIQMENYWMESFLLENSSSLLATREDSEDRKVYGKRASARHSAEFVDISTKLELGEHEMQLEQSKMESKQTAFFEEMKTLEAEKQEAEISASELRKAIEAFENLKLDPKNCQAAADTLSKFIKDLTRNGEIFNEFTRMKTATLRNDCKKLKRTLMKQEEMNSCLRPVDYELAMLEKRKLQRNYDEKLAQYKRCQVEVHSTFLKKNKEQAALQKASLDLKEIEKEIGKCKSSVERLKVERKISESDVEKQTKLVEDIRKLSSKYSAPSILDYIETIRKRDDLRSQVKVAKRKMEISKQRLINKKRLYFAKLAANKNSS